ncbi:MAG: EAL domain-containing protein [Gemmatimonadetes bacterium]|nr:EAL domain-containing protein [Gemmatimonadota bacterium]
MSSPAPRTAAAALNARMDSTATRLADAVITITGAGEIVYANPALQRLFGHSQRELIGHSILRVVPESGRAAHTRDLHRYLAALRDGVNVDPLELSARSASGAPCVFEVSLGQYRAGSELLYTGIVRDVTRRRQQVDSLLASESRYRQLFEQNVAGVYRVSTAGCFLEVNEAMARILGCNEAAVLTTRAAELYCDPGDYERWVEQLVEEGSIANRLHRLRRIDGDPIWVLESCSLASDPLTGSPCFVGTLVDISERKAMEEQLTHLAYHDSLTGLANRRLLQEVGQKAVALAQRHGTTLGLLYIDLIRFKRINDVLGHSAGDRVLCTVADRLATFTRASDTLARIGGDEFAMLIVSAHGLDDLLVPAARVRESLAPPLNIGGQTLHIEARIGAALFPLHAATFDELLTRADIAVHQPDANDTETAVYRPVGDEHQLTDLELEEDLRQAIAKDQVILHYQPVFRLPSRVPVGVEGLARWCGPDGRIRTASRFIPMAERAGWIHRIDRCVLEQAIRQLVGWSQPHSPAFITLNLAPTTLDDPDFPVFLRGLLDAAGVDGSRLGFEVTERVSVRNPERTALILNEIRQLGVRILLDDFGRGHSSFLFLRDLPVDALKIGRSLTSHIGKDRQTERLVEGLIALCHGLCVALVATGIETAEQLSWLDAHACDFAQGNALFEPAPADTVERLFAARSVLAT